MPKSAKSSTVLFDAVRGHGRQIRQLRDAVEAGRLPHAMLFAGPSGVGKQLVAKAVAQMLLCVEKEKPCGSCIGCTKVAGGLHPDVLSVGVGTETKSREILLDQIQELGVTLSRKPGEGGRTVVLMNEADHLNFHAQNAFLKSLEEPAGPTTFILIASDPNRLLPTIRSRCQMVRFGSLSAADTEDILIATDDFSPYEASEYARLSQGSVEEALLLKDGGYREVVQEAFFLVGLAREKSPVEWPKVATNRDELLLLVDALIRIHRDVLILAAAGDTARTRVFFTEQIDETAGSAQILGADRTAAILQSLAVARERLLSYVNPRLVSAQLLLDLGIRLL